jgi:hypothetical protein
VGKQDLTEVLNLKSHSFRLSLPDIYIAASIFVGICGLWAQIANLNSACLLSNLPGSTAKKTPSCLPLSDHQFDPQWSCQHCLSRLENTQHSKMTSDVLHFLMWYLPCTSRYKFSLISYLNWTSLTSLLSQEELPGIVDHPNQPSTAWFFRLISRLCSMLISHSSTIVITTGISTRERFLLRSYAPDALPTAWIVSIC